MHRTQLVAVVALLAAGCGSGNKSQTPAESAISIRVRPPAVLDRAAVVRVGGTVEPLESSEVGFQVAGRIRRVMVEEGQSVQAGQVLAELDPADYRHGVDMAAGEAAAARAVADKAQAGARKQELAQAQAAFDQAEDEYRRMKTLYERKSLAPNDFKKIEAHWMVAKQRLDEAQEGARREDIAAAKAKWSQAEANLQLTQKRLADTVLRAPTAGVVARRLADSGEVIGAGMPVVALMKLNPVRVRVGIPEAEVAQVRQGLPARVRIPAMENREFAGRVELLGFAAEPQSRTFATRILVPNPQLVLRAGMIAEAEIEAGARIQALTVPGEAIVRDAQGATLVYVYFPAKGRVFARRVQTGRAAGMEIEIDRGLTAQDLVVIAGQSKLREGAPAQAERVQGGR
ncbi:MAG: efflux RND transporter periplasmic adaptor subunit [Acidobacteria bacterium]|nr:efflux RND transporter periplasmic adaptor subunit [Acidobacteriota bacterium]